MLIGSREVASIRVSQSHPVVVQSGGPAQIASLIAALISTEYRSPRGVDRWNMKGSARMLPTRLALERDSVEFCFEGSIESEREGLKFLMRNPDFLRQWKPRDKSTSRVNPHAII
jgi:hypothetical protein